MGGQRCRPLDSDHSRIGIRDRRERAHCDEPAGDRLRDVGGSTAHAGRQSGGKRRRGRSCAGCRCPSDRFEITRIGAACAAGVRGVEAACRGRSADLHDQRSAPSAEGHHNRSGEPPGGACTRVRPHSCIRQRRWPRLHSRRRRGRDYDCGRRQRRAQPRRHAGRSDRRCVRRRRSCGEEIEGCRAAGWNASSS